MYLTKLKIVAAVLGGFTFIHGGWDVKPLIAADQSSNTQTDNSAASENKTVWLSPAKFQHLHSQAKPERGGFDDIPWMTSLWEARKLAAAEGKPLLVWCAEGNPIGFT